jgi:hypothetical protein
MAFEPSARSRKKAAASAARLLDPDVVVREYVVGRAHARMTSGATVALVVFAVAFVVALLAGQLILPGALLLLIIYNSVVPPRGIVVADHGLALFARSFWNGRPSKVLALLPFTALDPYKTQVKGSKVTISLANDQVTLSRKEFERLTASAAVVARAGS